MPKTMKSKSINVFLEIQGENKKNTMFVSPIFFCTQKLVQYIVWLDQTWTQINLIRSRQKCSIFEYFIDSSSQVILG